VTKEDRLVALLLALEPVQFGGRGDSRTQNNGGLFYSGRQKGSQGFCAAHLLHSKGGTLDFPDDERGNFDNIYQFAAAEYFVPNGTMRERIEASQEHEQFMRQGFKQLGDWILEQFRVPLFRVPRRLNRHGDSVLTVYPGYVVNDEGHTAAEIYIGKVTSGVRGQVSSALNTGSAILGFGGMKEIVANTVLEAEQRPPMARNRALGDSEL